VPKLNVKRIQTGQSGNNLLPDDFGGIETSETIRRINNNIEMMISQERDLKQKLLKYA